MSVTYAQTMLRWKKNTVIAGRVDIPSPLILMVFRPRPFRRGNSVCVRRPILAERKDALSGCVVVIHEEEELKQQEDL